MTHVSPGQNAGGQLQVLKEAFCNDCLDRELGQVPVDVNLPCIQMEPYHQDLYEDFWCEQEHKSIAPVDAFATARSDFSEHVWKVLMRKEETHVKKR